MKTIQDQAPNFRDDEGDLFLVKCFVCKRENYALNVALGICTWCGWKQEENKQS